LSVVSQIRPPAPTPALLKTKFGAPKRANGRRAERFDLGRVRAVEPERQHGPRRAHRSRPTALSSASCLNIRHHDVHAQTRGDARGLEAEARSPRR